MSREKDELYMNYALRLAKKAADLGEVPVGAVVVFDDQIVGEGYNQRETAKNAAAHAEMLAIVDACNRMGGWRLHRCQLYVTLEPCPMCAGAILNARLDRVIIGAMDKKAGAMGSVFDLFAYPLNHKPEVETGVLKEKCTDILSDFFIRLRERKRDAQKGEET